MTIGHSKVGASSMYRWANCPGSVRECAQVPNVSSKYAEEGQRAHEIAAACLRNDGTPGAFDPEGAIVIYLDAVRDRLIPGAVLEVEQGFHLKQIHPDAYGTSDATVWQPSLRHLHVFDYKHGAGVAVEVTGNPQLRYYALGALLQSGYNAREVTVTIVQPRCPHPDGPVRSETFNAYDLLEWAADLREAIIRTEAPDAPLVPGNHCRFCPAAAVCPALAQLALAVAQEEFSPAVLAGADSSRGVVPYDPAKLKLALDSRGAIKAWVKALDEFAYAEAIAGRLPAEVGYKLVTKRAERQWKDKNVAEVLLPCSAGITEDDYLEPRVLKSPAQVEKSIGKKAFKSIEDALVEKRSSGYTLAPESDKRPAVRVLDVSAEFTSVASSTDLIEE